MSRELDVLVAEKVMGWRLAINGRWSVPSAHPMSNMPSDVPGFTTDPHDDYEVLKHVREKWDGDMQDKFTERLGDVFMKRRGVSENRLNFALRYEPGDYSKAALNALGVNTTMTEPSDSASSEASEPVSK